MKKYHFTVIIERDEDGKYIASVPALPGCHTQADNIDTLDNRIREAIKLCIEVKNLTDIEVTDFVGVHQVEVAL